MPTVRPCPSSSSASPLLPSLSLSLDHRADPLSPLHTAIMMKAYGAAGGAPGGAGGPGGFPGAGGAAPGAGADEPSVEEVD